MIGLTLAEFSEEIGKDPKTVKRKLSEAGIDYEKRGKVRLRDLVAACFGDEYQQSVRNKTLDADLKQIEKDKETGRLLDPATVQEQIDATFGPIRQAILQAQAELPPRCNPQDHQTARRAIDQWVERFFPAIRDNTESKAL